MSRTSKPKSNLCAQQSLAAATLERDLEEAYDDHTRTLYAASAILYVLGGLFVIAMGTCSIIYLAEDLDAPLFSYGISIATLCLGFVTPAVQRWQGLLWERQERIRDHIDTLRQVYSDGAI